MKNYVFLIFLMNGFLQSQTVFADQDTEPSIKLKSGCIKSNPAVAGESDEALLKIYQQVCDRKNKENKDAYLVKAAERFQQLGQSYKAIELVGYLESKQIQSNTLTDVKFLAAAALAETAMTQIRDTESRYLTSELTFPVAVQLTESIKKIKPLSVTAAVRQLSVVQERKPAYTAKSSKQPVRTATKAVKNTSSRQFNPENPVKAPVRQNAVAVTAVKSSANPFTGLSN